MNYSEEQIVELLNENDWLEKAVEMLDYRLIDKGFNINNQWLGYYDEYALHYVPQIYVNNRCEKEVLNWGKLEIHNKKRVFNPYTYCNGKGIKYEKLNEFSIYREQWDVIKKYIVLNSHKVGEKKVCFDNPYPEPRVEFYQGSDVPINGYYE